MISHRITFLTPLFSRGSYDDRPEIRPPSIRGQLHWWFRALGGRHSDEKVIFGGVHNHAVASKIVVRVGNIKGRQAAAPTLPHKGRGLASEKTAFLAETSFELHLSERLGGLTGPHATRFRQSLEAWLLAGTLGLRATRAAGSFVWEPLCPNGVPMPQTQEAYSLALQGVFSSAPLKVRLLKETFATAEAARICISDTLGGRDDRFDDLARMQHPLGTIRGRRKTSPLRFRIVRISNRFHVVAVWDNRTAVTGNRPEDLKGIADLLDNRGKKIGTALKEVL